MAKIAKEELWTREDLPCVYVVTTNSYIKNNGALVMGRGAARQATQKIPGVAYEAGNLIRKSRYCFLIVRAPTEEKAGFGLFQVKEHWKGRADISLIRSSTIALREWCSLNPAVKVRMNFPGIGNGKLDREHVEPLLEQLPSQVTICYR